MKERVNVTPLDLLSADLRSVLVQASSLEAELKAGSSTRVPAHLDVVANVLATPAGFRLIDFEYAAMVEPARELGQVIWEAALDQPGAARLLQAYGRDSGITDEVTGAWAWIAGVTWTLWALSHRTNPCMSLYARRSWEQLVTFWGRPKP